MRTFAPGYRLSDWIGWVIAAMLVMTVACRPEAPPPSKEAFVQQGDQFLADKAYAKAAAAYQVAVGVDGLDGALRVKLANAYLLAGNWSAAEEHAVRASDLLPGDLEVQFLSAKLMLAQRRFVDVADRMQVFLKDHPDNATAIVLQANATAHLQDSTWALYSLPEAIRDRAAFLGARRAIRPGTASEDDKAAEALFRKALQLSPNDMEIQLALVNFLWATGRPEEGEEMLRRVADRYVGHAAVNYALGGYYLSKGRDAEGERYLKSAGTAGVYGRDARFSLVDHYIAVRRDTEALSVLNSMVADDDAESAVSTRLAAVEFRNGKAESATQRVDAILARDPGNKRALLLKAQFLSAASNWKEAVKIARAATIYDPKSGEARLALGRALAATGDMENAFKELSEALLTAPDVTEIPIELTRIALALGREQSALQYVRDAVRKNPDNLDIALSLAKTLVAVHDYAGADTVLRGLLARNPASPEVLTELGALEVLRGNNEAARAVFGRAVQANPNSFAAVSGIVSLDLKEKRINDARRRVDDAVAVHRDDPAYLLLAGRVYADVDASRAESLFREILVINPANESAALALSDVFRQARRLEDAKEVLDQLLAQRPDSVDGHTSLGLLFEQMGRKSDATAQYEKVLTASPHAARASFRLAAIYADEGKKLDDALSLALDAKRELSAESALSDLIGWLYIQKEQPRLALPHLQEATRRAPENPTFHFHLGIAYVRNEQSSRGREELRRALQIDSSFAQAAEARKALATLF